jgi:hypothetical protein
MMETAHFWEFGKDHDASNWFAIAFSLVVWPRVLLLLVKTQGSGNPTLSGLCNTWTKNNYRWPAL